MPITHTFDSNTIDKMKHFYHDHLVSKEIPYVLFQAKIEGCTITVYTSKKAVFAGTKEAYEASIWAQTKVIETPNLPIDPNTSHIGSDEVGTGDFFGPLVVGATYVPNDVMPLLKEAGIMDSKKIKDEHIPKLALLVKKHCLYATSVMTNQQYNTYIDKGYNQGAIKALLHNDALTKIQAQLNQTIPIIMDQFVHEKKYYDYLKHEQHVVHGITFLTKAEDKYLAVACGSIIARDLFLSAMDQISEKIGMTIPKGAGSHVDVFGVKVLHQFGPSIFNKIAKLHFSNMNRIKGMS